MDVATMTPHISILATAVLFFEARHFKKIWWSAKLLSNAS